MRSRRVAAGGVLSAARFLGGAPTRELVDAMRAESAYVPDREILGWSMGSLRLAWTRGSARSSLAFAIALAGAVACFIAADAELTEQQWAMGVLLSTSFLLGAAWPGLAIRTGLIVGSSLAVWHLALLAAGTPLPYPMEPRGPAGALTLLVLVVPGLAASVTGRFLRRLAADDAGAGPIG